MASDSSSTVTYPPGSSPAVPVVVPSPKPPKKGKGKNK